jgi:hypothetical protein
VLVAVVAAAVAAAAAVVVKQSLVLLLLLLVHLSWLAARSGQEFCHPPMWWSTPCSKHHQWASFMPGVLSQEVPSFGWPVVIHANTGEQQSIT